ncbi:MAG: hypothetical protein ACFE7E_03915 [Candidatus Hodarchaeota archaeon]
MSEKPENFEDAIRMLRRKGIGYEIEHIDLFGFALSVARLKTSERPVLIGIEDERLSGLVLIHPDKFEGIFGATKTVAYLGRAWLSKGQEDEFRKYAYSRLKSLIFATAFAEEEAPMAVPALKKAMEKEIDRAKTLESQEIVERDLEDLREQSRDLLDGLQHL